MHANPRLRRSNTTMCSNLIAYLLELPIFCLSVTWVLCLPESLYHMSLLTRVTTIAGVAVGGMLPPLKRYASIHRFVVGAYCGYVCGFVLDRYSNWADHANMIWEVIVLFVSLLNITVACLMCILVWRSAKLLKNSQGIGKLRTIRGIVILLVALSVVFWIEAKTL